MSRFWTRVGRSAAGFLGGAVAMVAVAAVEKDDFGWMTLAELGKIQVVTAAKRPEPAWTVDSALTVITPENIAFDGADSLPAALRWAPGLNVAQIDSRNWAVSARGFNAQYSNKLLVMVDGRSVYTPLFGGVQWDTLSTPLEDLARIEVVRGPGGALWGANAVNGVINIVTAPAAATPGALAVAEAGTTMRRGLVRQGFSLGPGWDARVHVQVAEREPTLLASGAKAGDEWRQESAGFRIDRVRPDAWQLTFSGEGYAGRGHETQAIAAVLAPLGLPLDPRSEADNHGGHLLARAERREPDGSGNMIQGFFDAARTRVPILAERRQTLDVELQHDEVSGAHVLSVGAGYRSSHAHTRGSSTAALLPANETGGIGNAFAQAHLAVVPGQFDVVAGAKFEHSEFGRAQVQPSLRAVWRVREGQVVWAALSRAERDPSFLERAVSFDAAVLPVGTLGAGSPPTLVRWLGSAGLAPETVVAAEAGWRARVGERVSVDGAVFLNRYDRLIDIVPGAATFPAATSVTPYRIWPWHYVNGLDGIGYGAELAATLHLGPRSQANVGYTFTRVEQSGPAGGANEGYFEASSPRHACFVRAAHGFGADWAVHVEGRAVGPLEAVGVRGYTALGARITWRATPALTVILAGENLTDPAHPEFRNGGNLVTTELARSGSLKLTWRQ